MQATQEVISRIPLTTEAEFNEAVQAAKDAFPSWSRTTVGTRARVMFKLQQLIWENKVGSNFLPLNIGPAPMHTAATTLSWYSVKPIYECYIYVG